MWHKFTESAKDTVLKAHECASERKSFLVLPHDLAVGAVKAEGSVCKELLERAGMDVTEFLQEVSEVASEPGKPGVFGQVGLSDSSKEAFDAGVQEAKKLGVKEITSEHIFIGALRASPEIQEILKAKGLVVDDLRQKLIELLDEPKPRP
jgi:ATP-dependent Clp protease ATP-binding subunit ClpA